MTLLDEKESTASLKIIVLVVSLLTFGAFGGMALLNAHSTAPQQSQIQQPGPLEESKPL